MTEDFWYALIVGILAVSVSLSVVEAWRARRRPDNESRVADQNQDMLALQREAVALRKRQVDALERIAESLDRQG